MSILKNINFQKKQDYISNPPVIINSDMPDDVQYDFNSFINNNDYSEVIKDFQRQKSITLPE